MKLSRLSVALALLLSAPVFAQAPGVAVEPKVLPPAPPELLKTLGELRENNKLLSQETIRKALSHPTPEAVSLPAPFTQPLDPITIAQQLRKSALRVGWYYLCTRCDHWHLNMSGGYVITSDGLAATCHHVLATQLGMREGYAFAATFDGKIYPITQILAADKNIDVAIFRLEGAADLQPLPLNDQTRPGQRVFLLSEPQGNAGYFSEGIINRFYWEPPRLTGNPELLADATYLRLNVSTDWAPGSSGSAVVDDCGNMVGHVSKISTILSPPPQPQIPPSITNPPASPTTAPTTAPAPNRPTPPLPHAQPSQSTHLIFHDATPARPIKLLLTTPQPTTRPSTTQQE